MTTRIRAQLLACALLLLPTAASAEWNQANDEANRQRMMSDMRSSAEANDRANAASQSRFNANAANSLGSGGSSGGSSSSSSSGSSGGVWNIPSHQPSGPPTIVASYNFTVRVRETDAQVVARLQREAAAGGAQAQFDLGRVYYTGYGVAQDDAAARRWFEAAAAQGHPPAKANLGYMMLNGLGGAKDEAKGLDWLKQAADQNVAFAAGQYGIATYLSASRQKADPKPAIAYMTKAADAGDVAAAAMLGFSYYIGITDGAPRDGARAAPYLKIAASAGDAQAKYQLGALYLRGDGVPADPAAGLKLINEAAAAGDGGANNRLAQLYMQGDHVAADAGKGAGYMKRAAELGYPEAMANYAIMLVTGQGGVAKDEAAGAAMTQAAAAKGSDLAQLFLGKLYSEGRGVPLDPVKTAEWYKQAAMNNNAEAAARWGMMLIKGDGGPKYIEGGAKLIRISAEAGDPLGEEYLARLYSDGVGVPQDKALAVAWFRKSAAQGDAASTTALQEPDMVAAAR